MDFIGTKKKMDNSKKTQTLSFVKFTQNPKAKTMTMAEITQKAISRGIQPGQMDKVELIRSTQRAEGNTPCFRTSKSQCLHTDCCFMADCLAV